MEPRTPTHHEVAGRADDATGVLLGELRPAVGVVHQRLRVTVTAGCTDLSAQDASAIGYRTRRARVNLRVGVDDRLGNGEQCLGSACGCRKLGMPSCGKPPTTSADGWRSTTAVSTNV